ncbi:MAG: TonB-dependent receptor [Bacteroidota bacterium]
MKKILVILTFLIANLTYAQNNELQTIKGQVVDEITKSPIVGATISLIGTLPNHQVLTDKHGFFILPEVPTGRQSLRISSIGYEEQTLQDLLVTSGKQIVVNISLTEKLNILESVVIKSNPNRNNNEMVAVSSRSFNPDDTRKFAGSLGDPSRMIANGAGVTSGNDSRNDIVVRGNSPSGVLWQMEGIDIPNPNHFGTLSSTGGPVSILNNNNLGKSDFYTGAFAAQYGNAISSAFDLRLRNGNSDTHEFLAEVNFTGFEFGAEGPLSTKSKASYLINYRYSTVDILSSMGLDVGVGKAVPKYQDVNFKLYIPISTKSKLSIWGLGGPSKVNFLGNDVDIASTTDAYGEENENTRTKFFKSITGLTYETNYTAKTYGKLSLGFSHTTENITRDSISVLSREAFKSGEHQYFANKATIAYNLSHKFNAKNSLAAGISGSLMMFDLYNKSIFGGGISERINLDQENNMSLIQGYVQWKHRFTEKLSFNAGLHAQALTLNNTTAFEPRLGMKYIVNNKNVFSLGYGMHHQIQSPVVYFYQTKIANQVHYTNKNLDFTRSQHLIAGYTYYISNNLNLKSEVYYQHIKNVPVEQKSSGFSMLNEGADFSLSNKDSLQNLGSGKNYGIELSLEKNFSKGSYFLITASLFDSKYKGSDGVQRNTAFNSKYVFNALAGKDFKIGKNKNTLSFNVKLSTIGGRYTSPVNIKASQIDVSTIYDETISPFSIQQKAYFRTDFKGGYRVNYKKSTLEFGIDLQNINDNKNVFMQKFNKRTNAITTEYQQGFLPVPYFRLNF